MLKSGGVREPTSSFGTSLHHYQIDPKTFFGLIKKQLRYTEGIIEIGEQITVVGIVKRKSLRGPLAIKPYSKIATLEASEQQNLIITDVPEVLVLRK